MNGQSDDVKGRAKEAVGDLTDDEKMKQEGKEDRAAARAKDAVDSVREKIDEVTENVRKDDDDQQ
ncbi:MAG TPA: CsbD family protein [Acidimicrobiales bacterium]|jgi:uncharacterized protein YjbJ (UPF0337 family)|nr:CsbD family protein [Acidimicrobiales bacterium]